ncbi:monooxygenase [Candidimonas sp. SYP-B2681]|uniref:FAD-dependent monooxygenase n=1 Tax=Candidimonas sp. SYP-B2681 TaxID=2497686 RepID=UPI000F893B76|nr:FAD-dependent monooxygenase [Candidimonas sp. SYP-B2681]RTZ42303.1 monooxygenase [Candidimonas sp. SYP-B2681]
MDLPTYDIAISGAGPAGSALALMLASRSPHPERIAVLGPRFIAPGTLPQASGADPRTLALNQGSRVLLEHLNAWPDESASIEVVHVSQRGRLGRTLIDHAELGVPRLGSVVSYDALLASMHEALARSGVDLIEATPSQQLASGRVEWDLGDRRISSTLAVQSDGARPQGIHRDYKQHAVLATVRVSRPRRGWAFERFTAQGPLAILPHPHDQDLYGVVWCCAPAEAAGLLALTDDAFEVILHETFGDRLGGFGCIGGRHLFPLSLHAGPSLTNARNVAIGNAAQTLHPVAGQGLNLGLRDAAQLAQALLPWLAQPQTDATHLLAQFARARRPDRWLTAGITDFLPRVFATGNPLVEHACGLALLSLDLLPPLRNTLARQLLQGLRT